MDLLLEAKTELLTAPKMLVLVETRGICYSALVILLSCLSARFGTDGSAPDFATARWSGAKGSWHIGLVSHLQNASTGPWQSMRSAARCPIACLLHITCLLLVSLADDCYKQFKLG